MITVSDHLPLLSLAIFSLIYAIPNFNKLSLFYNFNFHNKSLIKKSSLSGKISDCTKTNISTMIKGELGSNKYKAKLAQKAKDAGFEEPYTFIDQAARDEARHAKMLQGMLKRL